MEIQISDWLFQVNLEATFSHTFNNSLDHCECAYCKNYYECVDIVYPEISLFLAQFGAVKDGPSELMPFEPTVMLACYRIVGSVLCWGNSPIMVGAISVTVEAAQDGTFLLWIGEFVLPWCQPEPEENVTSPANTLEFMERMRHMWLLRHEDNVSIS